MAFIIIASITFGVPQTPAAELDLLGAGWGEGHSPVTVLIKAGRGVSEAAIEDVIDAFEEWQGVLNPAKGEPDLVLLNTGNRADITIQMRVGGGSVLGQALPKTISPFSCELKNVSIQLSGKAFGQDFSNAGTYNVALHELGHALGLGHSDDPDDLMYASAESEDIFGEDVQEISPCDKEGIDAIYPLPAHCNLPVSVTCTP
jgi:predicted Zn-dependent protease